MALDSSDAIAIEKLALPLAGHFGPTGISLALRFRNTSPATVVLRCRLVDLQRQLPNGHWEAEDWFRPRWLKWVDGSAEAERLVPGAERDCEMAQHQAAWATTSGPGSELMRNLLPGKWRASIDVEAEGFKVRRLTQCFEWRAPNPLSAGSAFHWLKDCPPLPQ